MCLLDLWLLRSMSSVCGSPACARVELQPRRPPYDLVSPNTPRLVNTMFLQSGRQEGHAATLLLCRCRCPYTCVVAGRTVCGPSIRAKTAYALFGPPRRPRHPYASSRRPHTPYFQPYNTMDGLARLLQAGGQGGGGGPPQAETIVSDTLSPLSSSSCLLDGSWQLAEKRAV